MLDNWSISGISHDRPAPGYRYDRSSLGICFDLGRIGSGRYGQRCWEILWRAVEPRLIAGSQLFEGNVLDSERTYCLAIQNSSPERLGLVMSALRRDPGFLEVCAAPSFYEGEDVLREPLVAAGLVNDEGLIIGISYNPRRALNQVRREQAAAAGMPQVETVTVAGAGAARMTQIVPAEASGTPRKWWQVLKL